MMTKLSLLTILAAQSAVPAGDACGRLFDPKTLETVSGRIAALRRRPHGAGMEGAHLTLAAEKGPVEVSLGPAWYLDRQETRLAEGDQVEVRGSRVTCEGRPVLVAAEVRVDGAAIRLRDETGAPAWAGGGRRRRD